MREEILNILSTGNSLTVKEMTMHILVSLILGIAIYISYKISHEGTMYSKKFNVSLVILSTLTGMVMTVIGNNVALSLGMVGALSIVRFRTAIKDSRDTVYIFWAIIVGICCGVGDYSVAVIGSIMVFIITLIFGAVKDDDKILLVIRADRNLEKQIEEIVEADFNKKAKIKVKNTTKESVEFIYELSPKVYELNENKEKSITDEIYDLGSVEYVNIVIQKEEISG